MGVRIGLGVGPKVGLAVGRGGPVGVGLGDVEVVIAVAKEVEAGRSKQINKGH